MLSDLAHSRLRWLGGLLLLGLVVTTGCISEQREREMGDRLAARVNRTVPLIDDADLVAYLYLIGEKLAAASDRPDLDYHFYLVDRPVVNAFALPGGHVYVTLGLIERARNGSEFAGVLAHEIAHVAARHGVQRLERQMRTGTLVSTLYRVVLGDEPALLRQGSLETARIAWSARHSRRNELEADRLAVEYLVAAGIEPEGVVTLLESLLREEGTAPESGGLSAWFASHPLTSTRIAEARAAIDEVQTKPGSISTDVVRELPIFRTRAETLLSVTFPTHPR